MSLIQPVSFEAALDAANQHARNYLAQVEGMPVGPALTAAELRQRLNKPLAEQGIPPEEVVHQLGLDAAGGLMQSPGSRFFGWVIGGTLPAALAADWMTTAWDQNAASYSTSPASAMVEEIVGGWLKELLRLPSSASFALVTGCQLAHFTCLAAARHAVLHQRGWDVERRGLFGAPPIHIVTSDLLHGSAERAIRFAGIGTDQIIRLPSDTSGRLPAATLAQALQSIDGPVIVILQAGDVNVGAFDSFRDLIPIAKRHGAWVHVDGAFGLWAAASPRFRHLVADVATADSWATDGHKWLNVPFDCGYAFVADSGVHQAAMAYRAAYISYAKDARDPADWNPEWSRRARGFATYAAIRQLGRRGIAEMIERCCDMAELLTTGIGRLPGAELIQTSPINQGLVRFLDPRPGATAEDHDRRTAEVVAGICASGEAWFSDTVWKGRRAMRISVCNWRTDRDDVDRVIQAVATVVRQRSA
ncbi:MAG: aspartate aminotransferase family protein [Opitutaceae bacterium]|nr:aspartate aminotransferase family protein [Opitutaceae bacterium]